LEGYFSVHGVRKYDGVDGPRVAIAHDYLTQRGGAEKCTLVLSRAFPEAPIYTMLYEPSTTYPEFADRDVRVSALNKVPLARRYYRATMPILPLVARSMFVDADVVVTSSSGWAHGFRTNGHKLVYCHSPARWLYQPDLYLGENAGLVKRLGLKATTGYLKAWDRRSALSCDRYLANSTMIKSRIADAYGIDADVLLSSVSMSANDDVEPVDELGDWLGVPPDGAYYLCVGRLLPYKNVDAIIRAFANTSRRLVVVGAGPEAEHLRSIKTDNVLMLSDLSFGQVCWLYKHCRALITASYEDFGLTPLEAGVWGRPTVALRYGGMLDTVDEGISGMYFDQPEPQAISEAVDRFEASSFDSDKIRRHVEKFSEDQFIQKFRAAVDEMVKEQTCR
jgi:glycosyltransferase involved in cell wall biosynthesis